MTAAGIIAEYNPMHNGHLYLINQLKGLGADYIAVVMSGNFVQRGEAATLSKWARTKQALASGADLVLELPLPWALAGAEHFALGGVSILDSLGVNLLGFGSECGNLKLLQQAGNALSSPLLHEEIRKFLQKGITFAAARQQAVENLFGKDMAALLSEPNNVLGIEYLKAIDSLKSSLLPCTVQRTGSSHGDGFPAEGGASSSAVRNMFMQGKDVSAYVPASANNILLEEKKAGHAPANLQYLERGILAKLRTMSRKDFSHLPDLSEGLENRVYAAAQKACSITELYKMVKTKRYPLARIRRIVLSAFLGIDTAYCQGTPPYLRILGIGNGGEKILQAAKTKSQLPIIAKYSDTEKLDTQGKRTFELENRAADLYSLCMPKVEPCGTDRSHKVIVF